MNNYLILIAVLLPIIGAIPVPMIPFRKRGHLMIYLEVLTVITSVITWKVLLGGITEVYEVIYFVENLSISFKVDGMTMVFAGLVSFLWPLAMLYSFEYMEHEKHEKVFFMFYSITYGITLGIAFSSDMLSMYFFYELLTLSTLPLVMHTLTREAILASRKYLYYSLGGAAFAMIGLVFLIVYGNTLEFTMGGVLNMGKAADKIGLLRLIYVLAFFGFGVKAAIFPLCSWLPQAGVAPTPVTALLHAVAVVKAGVFGIIRLTFYSFGTEILVGSWAQTVPMVFAAITIVYGCSRALKETQIKRRLAYSTVSNLSYVIFGVTLMTTEGLTGALSHMLFHAIMKILAFFCAGAFMIQTGKSHLYEMDGCGRKMPIVFGTFTVSALGLMGVPGFAGFISKWNLARAALDTERILPVIGVGCLLASALLTAIYMLNVVNRAFFPAPGYSEKAIQGYKDPGWKIKVPLVIFAILTAAMGLFSAPLIAFLEKVSAGIL